MTVRRPLRVLELRTVRGTGGGPEKTILLGTARTDPERYAVTVCYVRDERDPVFAIDQKARDLAVDYLEVRERSSFDPRIWRKLVEIVRERQIDIVHAHDYKTDILAWLLGRRTGVIPLATAHGWTGHSPRERRLYYPADRWVLARFPHVIAVSSDIREVLRRAGADPARVTVVLNGIDPDAFRRTPQAVPQARAAFGVTSGDLVFGAVGRLEPQKEFATLISSFAPIAAAHPSARLLIAGDGSLRAALDDGIRGQGLTGRVRLLGHVADVPLLHHALDVFVQASSYEGTPNAVLEAMALGTPIVATDAGGTAELARDGAEALIVPSRDGRALTAAMTHVVERREAAAARATAARRRVETTLSFAQRQQHVERIYDRLAAEFGGVERGTGAARHA